MIVNKLKGDLKWELTFFKRITVLLMIMVAILLIIMISYNSRIVTGDLVSKKLAKQLVYYGESLNLACISSSPGDFAYMTYNKESKKVECIKGRVD